MTPPAAPPKDTSASAGSLASRITGAPWARAPRSDGRFEDWLAALPDSVNAEFSELFALHPAAQRDHFGTAEFFSLSLGSGERRRATAAEHSAVRSRRAADVTRDRNRRTSGHHHERKRNDADVARDESARRAPDRACRHWKSLAGDAGHRGADRTRRHGLARGVALSDERRDAARESSIPRTRRSRKSGPAISSWRWARWVRSNSIIRAISISSSCSIRTSPRCRPAPRPPPRMCG